MQRVNLEVKPREEKNPNQLRRDGQIPGVIYGHGKSVSVTLNAKEFAKAIHTKAGLNALFNVTVGSESTLAIIKEIQRNMFTQAPTHVDIQRINVKEKLEVSVPVHAIGVANGVKNFGGIMEYILREIRVRCLPDDIPASLDVDVTNLNVGQSVKLSDITPPKGVEYITTPDHLLINVVAPKVEEEAKPAEAAAPGAAGAEPEVITKGKKEEEGAAAAGAKPGAAAPAAGAKAAAPAAKEEKKK